MVWVWRACSQGVIWNGEVNKLTCRARQHLFASSSTSWLRVFCGRLKCEIKHGLNRQLNSRRLSCAIKAWSSVQKIMAMIPKSECTNICMISLMISMWLSIWKRMCQQDGFLSREIAVFGEEGVQVYVEGTKWRKLFSYSDNRKRRGHIRGNRHKALRQAKIRHTDC